jgi:hypothetical protein
MIAFRRVAKPAALLAIVVSMGAFSGTARAETGWLWFDSVFTSPAAPSASVAARPPMKRAKVVRPVAVAPAQRPILVSSATPEVRPACFWCGRPVFISGLSF